MKLRTLLRAAAAALFVPLLLTVPLSAQTVLSSTTLSAAVADSSTRTISVTSATGITAPGVGITQVVLVIDREVMGVTAVNGTTISVTRGPDTRPAPHNNGAIVWVAPRNAIASYIPSGSCTRANQQYVPLIVGAGPGLGQEVGTIFDCLGVGAAGQWVQTNGNGASVLGSTVASTAGVIAATGNIFKVSGTSAITGITAPAGIAPGFTIQVEPTGVFTWTTATNIILAGTAVVGKILYFVWDGAKWVPSYIA